MPARDLNGYRWPAGFCLKAYGVRIGIRCDEPTVLQATRSYLPNDWETDTAGNLDRTYAISVSRRSHGRATDRLYSLCVDDLVVTHCSRIEALLDKLESDVRITVAERARHRIFVHAGAVGWKGKAVVIPGRSHAGKSSLVAELVRRGATYYSDEYAVCDSRGRVHPFQKPLELREEGKNRQVKIDIAALGGNVGTAPLQVGLVLMTKFRSTATWKPRELSRGQGVLELLAQTVSARRNPERALATLEKAVRDARILKGVRGEAAEMVGELLTRYAEW